MSEPKPHWNYRVLAFVSDVDDEVVFQICEVHYDVDGNKMGYTDGPTTLSSEGIKGLKWILARQREALNKPILYGGDKFPQEYP